MAKTTSVKIPVELVEIAKARDEDKPPGEVLFEMVKDYERLREYAGTLIKKDIGKSSVSEIIIDYYNDQDARIEEIKKSQIEITKMLEGLEIFFKKVKK